MKRFLQLFSLMALPFFSQGQITIQADQVDPLGLFAIQARDSVLDASIVPGGTGLQTWDMSALKDQATDTLVFTLPSETPYDSIFPQATLAAFVDSIGYIYFEQTNDHLSTVGSYGTISSNGVTVTTALKYVPGRTIIKFPMEYNTNYGETIKSIVQVPGGDVNQPFFDSIRVVSTTIRTVEIDAYGTMTSPIGTFNTLRSKEVRTDTDSIYFLSGTIWSGAVLPGIASDTTYNWWTNENGFGLPVVSLQIDDDNDTRASWLYSFVSPTNSAAQIPSLQIYPNPSADVLNVEVPDGFIGKIEVYNLIGSRLYSNKMASEGIAKIDLKSYDSGNYLVALRSENGNVVGMSKFQVAK